MTEVIDPTLAAWPFDYVVPASPADLRIPADTAVAWPQARKPAASVAGLERVWLAAARLESLQWEMDAAQEALAAVLRKAAAGGAEPSALSEAAGMAQDELQAMLR